MNRARHVGPRPHVPATSLANLATLLFGCAAIAALFGAVRGPGLRFATVPEAGEFGKASTLRVDVLEDGTTRVDGAPAAADGVGAAVAARLAERPGAGIVLVVSPGVPYRAMLAAFGAIAALPQAPPISIPPRSWVDEEIRRSGEKAAQ